MNIKSQWQRVHQLLSFSLGSDKNVLVECDPIWILSENTNDSQASDRLGPPFALSKLLSILAYFFWGILMNACVISDRIPTGEEPNLPPSVVSAEGAEYPVGQVIALDPPSPSELGNEERFDVVVRDGNVEQSLQYKVFLDRATNAAPIEKSTIASQSSIERRFSFRVSREILTSRPCRKLELFVSAEFDFEQDHLPVEPGDVDVATWWILSQPSLDRTECGAQ